ncbi:CHAT domain-containing protein [Sulfidibacter corallicola]|uniref:CHAT domain-containing protein n=1 Tax=Sulfidibacter corallicola TaxID=2818388 RepID=A0A8A4TS63_SULCO|nr:CHAT domain-containing protein [Sulfidibacter corallicola]QTD51878.1 CHAT domain-containing protein [Sulfidibacter corallicola]
MALAPQAEEPERPGVVIESLLKDSVLRRVGVRPGDVFFRWERLPNPPANPQGASGTFASPFDWELMERAQSPRGDVQLFGARDGVEQVFRIPRGVWMASVRPHLSAAAESTYLEGKRLVDEGQTQAGLRLWSRLPQRAWFAYRAGQTRAGLQEWEEAEAAYRSALDALGKDHPHAFLVRYEAGWMEEDRSRWDQAEKHFRAALEELERRHRDELLKAHFLRKLGILAWKRGELAKAKQFFGQDLEIKRKLAPGTVELTNSLNALGGVAWKQGAWVEAERFFLQASKNQEALAPESIELAAILNNLGVLALERQEWKKAERFYLRALTIYRKGYSDAPKITATLNNLGIVALRQGDKKKAVDYYRQGLEIQEKLAPDSLDVAVILNNIGELQAERGEWEEAERYHRRAIAIQEKLAPNSLDLASNFSNLGGLAVERGQWEEAEDHYLRALSIREVLVPGSTVLAMTLHRLGNVALKRGKPELAMDRYRRAIESFEDQMAHLGGTVEVRARYRGNHQAHYKNLLALLIDQGRQQAAFDLLERYRAQTVLEMMAEREFGVSVRDIPAELIEARNQVGFRYQKTKAELAKLGADHARVDELRVRLFDIRGEYDAVLAQIRQRFPRAAPSTPRSLKQVQQSLDPATLMLSYGVLEDRTVLFAVRRQAPLQVFTIPKGETYLQEKVHRVLQALQRDAELGTTPVAIRMLRAECGPLFELLVGPVMADAESVDRLVVVPDGPLQKLPFAVLFDKASQQYLIEKKPLSTVVSATVHAELKQRPRKAHAHIVAMGDPVYPDEDPNSESVSVELHSGAERGPAPDRIPTSAPAALQVDPIVRSQMERSGSWPRLPQTAQEVHRIAALYGDKVHTYLRQEATEDNLKAIGSEVDILHIAAHAFTNDERALDSGLVLTINRDFKEGEENGILHAWEIIERMRLDADLVVLSACQTGLGKEAGGEGLIGLTHAFQFAGARSMIASYWNVHDITAAVIMDRFYGYLKGGDDKTTALQKAQIDLIRFPITVQADGWLDRFLPGKKLDASHPYYWAGFQLIGPWD